MWGKLASCKRPSQFSRLGILVPDFWPVFTSVFCIVLFCMVGEISVLFVWSMCYYVSRLSGLGVICLGSLSFLSTPEINTCIFMN